MNAFTKMFPDRDFLSLSETQKEQTRNKFCKMFKKCCDEAGVSPYKLGKELSSMIGKIANGDKPVPGPDAAKVVLEFGRTVVSDQLAKKPFIADMISGMLYDTLSNNKSVENFLQGLMQEA